MTTTIQKSFNAGELSPVMIGRVDLAKYSSGLKTLVNAVLYPQGGLTRRPGLEFIGEAKNSGKKVRLIPFEFSVTQAYMLELGETPGGDGYLRFYMDGGRIYDGGSPYELVNGVSGVVIPWKADEFPMIQYTQSADTMFLVHPNWPIQELTRSGHTSWNIQALEIGPLTGSPENIALTQTGTTGTNYRYKITAVDADTYEESNPGGKSGNISGATQTNPVVITDNGHPYENGEVILIEDVLGMTELNGNEYTAANKTANTYELSGINGTAYTAYTSGGKSTQIHRISAAAALNASNYVNLSWDKVAGVSHYYVYREKAGTYGYLARADTEQFKDDGSIVPNVNDVPPAYRNPFQGAGNYPSCITFHEERLATMCTLNKPQAIFLSQSAGFKNFNISYPLKDDDACTFILASNTVDVGRWLVSLRKLIIGTAGGEWAMSGATDSEPITPTKVDVKPQSAYGSEPIIPVVVGNTILFVQRGGKNLMECVYAYETDGYQSEELLVLATHLTENNTLKQLTYQQMPHRIVWSVRDDGVLLGLTYMKAHEVMGWHRHITDGKVEAIATIPGIDGNDELWLAVRRAINGTYKRYIERMAPPFTSNTARDAFYVDSGLTFHNEMDVEGATQANPVVITATGHGLTNGKYGYIDRMPEADAQAGISQSMTELNGITYKIANVTANTFELQDENGNNIDGTGFTVYTGGGKIQQMAQTISGLDHLEGREVQILADGSVHPPLTVSSGSITLERRTRKAHIGLKYNTDVQTLPITLGPEQGTIKGKKKRIIDLTVNLHKSLGFKYGDSFDSLGEEFMRSSDDLMGEPLPLFTGERRLGFDADFEYDGNICIRQELPLPLTVLAIVPVLEVP